MCSSDLLATKVLTSETIGAPFPKPTRQDVNLSVGARWQGYPTTGFQFAADVAAWGCFGESWSDEKVARFCKNPWDIIQSRTNIIPFSTAAAVGAETIDTAAATWASWSGQPVNINVSVAITADAASWDWTANPIDIDEAIALVAATWNWATNAININIKETIATTAAAWNWAAQPITLGETLELVSSAWNWTTNAITVNAESLITTTAATWNWSAKTITLIVGETVTTTAAVWS